MARCSLILSNMEKSLGSHECGPKGLSNFGCLPRKCFPFNYYTEYTNLVPNIDECTGCTTGDPESP